jgi:ubiquinone/menaquinone biosynthesis C-methylase UbiE
MSDDTLRRYYARRAAQYERIYHKPERQHELRMLEAALPACFAQRRVLEVACGTGWWTAHAARDAQAWLATDANHEPLEIARAKAPMPPQVCFALADAWVLDALPGSFDAAFAGFWVSHLPRAALAGWFARLHARLAPGARVVLIDNLFVEGSSTPIARTDAGTGDTWQQRTLDDGSTHEVLKNFLDEATLRAALPGAGDWRWTPLRHYWLLAYRC